MKRWIISALFIALCCTSAVALDDGDQASDWFGRLQSGSAQERDRAQRWLAVNLTVEHYPLLAKQARLADAEARRRLTLALASAPQHLGLVLLLVGEQDRVLQNIGDVAFEDLATRWCPRVNEKSASAHRVAALLVDSSPQTFSFGGTTAALEVHIDRLDRRAGIGVPLVLEPGIADRELNALRQEATGFELLDKFCAAAHLVISGVGDWDQDLPGRGAWVLISTRSKARSISGATRLLGWFRAVQENDGEAAAAARALATCAWPAALQWLDQRWSTRQDRNALEGLLAAASRGRSSRSMLSAELRRHLLSLGDQALESRQRQLDDLDYAPGQRRARVADRWVERIARGLIGAGSMQLGGESSSSLWTQNWAGLNGRQRWLRLVILEGQRTGDKHLTDWLAQRITLDTHDSIAVRFQALRALGSLPIRPPAGLPLFAWGDLVAWSYRIGQPAVLARLVSALELKLPRENSPAVRHTQLFRLHLAFLNRDLEAAVSQCLVLGRNSGRSAQNDLTLMLEQARFESGPAFVRQVAQQALGRVQGSEARELSDIFLFSGALVAMPSAAEFPAAKPGQELAAQEFKRLGAWAGVLAGSRARASLLGAVKHPPSSLGDRQVLVAALELAVQRLREDGQDEAVTRFTQQVWLATTAPESALHYSLSSTQWPSRHSSLVIKLEDLDRVLSGRE